MENNKAEVKPFKVGEPLVDDESIGNTEPSILENSNRACVETRRRVCIKCNNVILNKRSIKYCSSKCRVAYLSYKSAVKVGRIIKPGVGSGGNQWEDSNSQYTGKSGAGGCIRAKRKLAAICNRCKSTKNLVAHHIDHNRENNELSNFEILCKRCHQKHHETRDAQGKYTKV